MIREADGRKPPVIDGKLVAHLDRCGRMIRRAYIAIVVTVLFLLVSLCAVCVTLSGVFVGAVAHYLLYVDGFFAAATVMSAGLTFWWFRKAGKSRVGVEMIRVRYQPGGKSEEFIIVFPPGGEKPIEVLFSEFRKLGGRFKIPPVRSYKLPRKVSVFGFWNSCVIEMECFISISENTSPVALFRFCPRPISKKGIGFEEKVLAALGEWLSKKCSSCISKERVFGQLNIIGKHLRKHSRIIFGAGFSIEARPSKIFFGEKMAWRDDAVIVVSKEVLHPHNWRERKAWDKLTPRDKERMEIREEVVKRVRSALR